MPAAQKYGIKRKCQLPSMAVSVSVCAWTSAGDDSATNRPQTSGAAARLARPNEVESRLMYPSVGQFNMEPQVASIGRKSNVNVRRTSAAFTGAVVIAPDRWDQGPIVPTDATL